MKWYSAENNEYVNNFSYLFWRLHLICYLIKKLICPNHTFIAIYVWNLTFHAWCVCIHVWKLIIFWADIIIGRKELKGIISCKHKNLFFSNSLIYHLDFCRQKIYTCFGNYFIQNSTTYIFSGRSPIFFGLFR